MSFSMTIQPEMVYNAVHSFTSALTLSFSVIVVSLELLTVLKITLLIARSCCRSIMCGVGSRLRMRVHTLLVPLFNLLLLLQSLHVLNCMLIKIELKICLLMEVLV